MFSENKLSGRSKFFSSVKKNMSVKKNIYMLWMFEMNLK